MRSEDGIKTAVWLQDLETEKGGVWVDGVSIGSTPSVNDQVTVALISGVTSSVGGDSLVGSGRCYVKRSSRRRLEVVLELPRAERDSLGRRSFVTLYANAPLEVSPDGLLKVLSGEVGLMRQRGTKVDDLGPEALQRLLRSIRLAQAPGCLPLPNRSRRPRR